MPVVEPIYEFQGLYRFLSNFWPCEKPIVYGFLTFPTVEHAYQAAKSSDLDYQHAIQLLKTPGQAKRYGKTAILVPNWDTRKLEIMDNFIKQKFFAGSALAKQLVATAPHELIEGNAWGDTFWGKDDYGHGKGYNHLGKLQMIQRAHLMEPK